MLQITPQMRILVAVEAVDFRKGIDSLAELCRAKLKCRSLLRLSVCVPQPAGAFNKGVGLRWAGILVGDQASVQRTLSLVAAGGRRRS
jgi:hypothetical protein